MEIPKTTEGQELQNRSMKTLVVEATRNNSPQPTEHDVKRIAQEFLQTDKFKTSEIVGLAKEAGEGRFSVPPAKEMNSAEIGKSIQQGLEKCTTRQKEWSAEDYNREALRFSVKIIAADALIKPQASHVNELTSEFLKNANHDRGDIQRLAQAVEKGSHHLDKIDKPDVSSFSDSVKRGIEAVGLAQQNHAKPNTFEDLIEHARDRGLNLPKAQMEFIRTSLEHGKASPEQLKQNIDQIAAKHDQKGYRWYVQTDHDPKYPLMRFMDKSGETRAYVVERVNKETQQHFYVANRINDKGDHLKVTSNDSLEAVRNHVAAYYTGATIKEMSQEMSRSRSPEKPTTTQDVSKPEKKEEFTLTR